MLRLTAHWLIPVDAPPVREGAVLVGDDGRILAAGPAATVASPAHARALDLGDAALMPGLVNVHAHPELTAYRGLIEDLAFPDWIEALKRSRVALTDEVAALSARWTVVEAIAAGVTTLAATERTGAALTALVEAGLRGIVYREVFGPDPALAADSLAGLRDHVAAMRCAETDLVRVGVSPHAPFSVSDALFTAVAGFSAETGLPVAVHAAESAAERRFVTAGEGLFADRLRARGIAVARRGRSTIELLERTGILARRPLLIHCVDVDDDDVDRIIRAGASVAHCPAANARLGHGIAPVSTLVDAGVPVGLGSDSVASNNRIDILEEARLAQMFQRARLHDPSSLPAVRALRMATLDGARALGLDHVTGAIRPGLDADLCAVSLAAPHVRPVHDPVAAVVMAARASDVVLTMVRGRILHGDGRDVRRSAAPLRAAFDEAAARLAAALQA